MRLWSWLVAMLRRRNEHLLFLPELDQDYRLEKAREQVKEAEQLLKKVQGQRPRVQAHATEMRNLRRENGFAAIISDALRGNPQ